MSGNDAMAAADPQRKVTTMVLKRSDQPTVRIVGAGGAGINILKQFINAYPTYNAQVLYDVADTSESNLKGLHNNVKPFIIDKNGSGKVRAANADTIQDEIERRWFEDNEDADIHVLVFSMSGGTGSVLGPLLAKALTMRGKPVILAGILDACSKLDTTNSANTLKTLNYLAEENDLYFPLMLFSNMGTSNRRDVDASIMVKIRTILEALIDPSITELDLTDKLNFINPLAIGQGEPGCYTFDITSSDLPGELPGEIQTTLTNDTPVFSSLAINAGGAAVAVNANVAYIGIMEQDKTFTAVNGLDLNTEAIDKIMLSATRYGSLKHAQNIGLSKIDKIDGKKSSSGLIL